MGWIKTATGEYSLGFLLIGVGLALSGGIALAMRGAVASEHAAPVEAPSRAAELIHPARSVEIIGCGVLLLTEDPV